MPINTPDTCVETKLQRKNIPEHIRAVITLHLTNPDLPGTDKLIKHFKQCDISELRNTCYYQGEIYYPVQTHYTWWNLHAACRNKHK
jgi:hypothetical protein